MPRRSRRPVLLPDEVVPTALTDPRLQHARDRRWARRTTAGSMAVLTLVGAALIELFQPGRTEVVAEKLDKGVADKAMRVGGPGTGGGRFDATVHLDERAHPPR